jgi:hypothetical protein|tara:strand:- start:25090 stop:25311 length:222 start_codon:yes stop_codon:yes gene_type:complete
MFNLYTNAIDQNGFMGLVSKNSNSVSKNQKIKNRRIVSGFVIVGMLVLTVISTGSQNQIKTELEQRTSYTSIV